MTKVDSESQFLFLTEQDNPSNAKTQTSIRKNCRKLNVHKVQPYTAKSSMKLNLSRDDAMFKHEQKKAMRKGILVKLLSEKLKRIKEMIGRRSYKDDVVRLGMSQSPYNSVHTSDTNLHSKMGLANCLAQTYKSPRELLPLAVSKFLYT